MNGSFLPLLASFYSRDETLHLFLATVLLGIFLLPAGGETRIVVRQTLAFSFLCFIGNLAAVSLAASGADGPAAVIHGMLLLALGIGVIRLVGLLIFRIILPRLSISAPRLLEDIVVIVGYLAWGMIRLSNAGLELSSIVTTSAIITAVLAFSMQDTLGNILGGLALQLDNSIEIGDWVKIDDVSGQVTDIRWRYTAIRLRDGQTVIVPNSQMMKGKVWLIGDPERDGLAWRRVILFKIGYVAQPTRVIATVEQSLREVDIDHVAKSPPPSCVLLDFGPGYGHYALRYWLTAPALDDPTDSAVRTHLFAVVQRAGWRFALDEKMLHLERENTALRNATKNRELQRRIDALQSLSLFVHLSAEECRRMAEHLVYAFFSPGDTLTRQGSIAHWLYIVIAGEAEVVRETDGTRQALAELAGGEFFGEMGLLTGEPRTATVIAKTAMECYRLDKIALEAIIRDRPEVAEELSNILANRLQHNTALHVPNAELPEHSSLRSAMVGKIRAFFNLLPPKTSE